MPDKIEEQKKGTYVAMKVKNGLTLHDWFKNEGVNVIPSDELHTTVAFSREPFEHSIQDGEVIVSPASFLEIANLGDEGAIVLKFNSQEMQDRFKHTQQEGAVYDYEEYIPHITITYDGKDLDLSQLKMPDFDLILGDECAEELDFSDQAIEISFEDKHIATYDAKNKKVISIRDGFQEYAGIELGMEPFDKIFKIYRSQEEVRGVADKLINIPLTNEHIDTDKPVGNDLVRGFINTSEPVEFRDVATDTHVIIENGIKLSDNMIQLVDNGKNELSLGYKAKLIPHELYDFQQVEIVPHHLAIVNAGRCGKICKFKDGEIMLKQFMDADGVVSLERVMELATQLPEVISKMDIKDLNKLVPMLEKVMESAGMSKEPEAAPTPPAGEGEMQDMDKEEVKTEAVEEFKDSQCFLDAQMRYADERMDTIEKAKGFLDGKYEFTAKSNLIIMGDALRAEKPSENFADSEIPVAFKMLAKKETVKDYDKFADSQTKNKWQEAAKETI